MITKTLYAAVPDIGVIGEVLYAIDSMGLFDTPQQAAKQIAKCHSSFGCCIYPVDAKVTRNVKRLHGLRAGSKCSGNRIVGDHLLSYTLRVC